MPSPRQMKPRKAIILFLLVALPLFSLINPVSSSNTGITELDLNPIEDTYVDSSEPNSKFGDSSHIYSRFWDPNYTQNNLRNSQLNFNLSDGSTDLFTVTANELDNWAIIVGVSDYKEIDDLTYTDDDAIDLCNKFKEFWPEDHIKLLLDENASKSNIESAIKDWLAPKETAESVVLFFFSGHGCQGYDVAPYDETDGKDEYLCPYDSLTYSYSNDIRDDTLDSWLGSLNSEHISVFLDSCYSGGFIDKATEKELLPSADVGDTFAKDLSKAGRVIITASSETESSWEYAALQHGVFAYYMLKGINNLELLDDNGDNGISAEEIFDYLAPLVRSYTNWKQHPQMYDGHGGELTLITTVTINFDTNPCETSIIIDEVTYTPPVTFVWPLYTEHTFSVSNQVWPQYGETRYIFTSWNDGNNLTSRTIIISESVLTSYTANYQTQYYLTVDSDYGNPEGEGWYDAGSTSSIEVESLVPVSEVERAVFTSWTGDTSSTSSNSTLIMDAPKQVSAEWQTQYYLTVDSDYGNPQGEGWYDSGSTSSFNVAYMVTVSDGKRVTFTSWSGDTSSTSSSSTLVMDSPKQVSAEWQTQYYLTVDVDPSGIVFLSGEGWYDEGSEALMENAPSTCSGGEGTRYIFEAWKVDDVAEGSNPISVLMDSPHSAVACYRTQYYLTVVSQHVPTEGEGWYDKGSEAAFSANAPQDLFIQNVFTGWSGDSTSTSQSAIIVMNSPKTVTANWREEYIQLYIIIIVIVAALAIISIVAVRKIRAR